MEHCRGFERCRHSHRRVLASLIPLFRFSAPGLLVPDVSCSHHWPLLRFNLPKEAFWSGMPCSLSAMRSSGVVSAEPRHQNRESILGVCHVPSQLNLSPFLDLNGSLASNLLSFVGGVVWSTGAGSVAASRLGDGWSAFAEVVFFVDAVLPPSFDSRDIASCTRRRSACCLRFSSASARSSRSELMLRLAK